MTRGDNYDHGMERSAAKGERERERKGASDGEQGVSPMKWSNIDFTQPVAIESRTIRLSLSLSLEYARPTIKHRAAIIFRLRSNRFQLRLTFRLKGYVRSLFRSATRISASAGNVPTCNDVPPTRNPHAFLFFGHLCRNKREGGGGFADSRAVRPARTTKLYVSVYRGQI